MLSYDARLRCDMVDLYYALYGTKRPPCLVNSELSAMFRPQKASTATYTGGTATLSSSVANSNANTTTSSSSLTATMVKVKTEGQVRVHSPVDDKSQLVLDTDVDVVGSGSAASESNISVDDNASRESGIGFLPVDGLATTVSGNGGDAKPSSGAVFAQTKAEPDETNSRQPSIKEEIIDVDELDIDGPPALKKPKTDYASDSSPAIPIESRDGTDGLSALIGPESGIFKTEEQNVSVSAEAATSKTSKSKEDGTQKVSHINPKIIYNQMNMYFVMYRLSE